MDFRPAPSGRLRWEGRDLRNRQPLGHFSRTSDPEHGWAQPADHDGTIRGDALRAVVEPCPSQARAGAGNERGLARLTRPVAECSDGPIGPGCQDEHLVRPRPGPAGSVEPAPADELGKGSCLVGLIAGLLSSREMVCAGTPRQAHHLVAEDRPCRAAQTHLGRRLGQDRRRRRAFTRRSDRSGPGRLARRQPEAENQPEGRCRRIQGAEHRGL